MELKGAELREPLSLSFTFDRTIGMAALLVELSVRYRTNDHGKDSRRCISVYRYYNTICYRANKTHLLLYCTYTTSNQYYCMSNS